MFRIVELNIKLELPKEETRFDVLTKQLADIPGKLQSFGELTLNAKKLEELIPHMQFSTDESELEMTLTKGSLQLQIRNPNPRDVLFIGRPREMVEKNYFEKDRLLQLNSDINYILGLIVGHLLTNKKVKVEGDLRLEEMDSKVTFNHLLKPPKIGKGEAKVNGLQFDTTAELFGTSIPVQFRVLQRTDRIAGVLQFTYDASSSLDLYAMTYSLEKVFNNMLKEVRGS